MIVPKAKPATVTDEQRRAAVRVVTKDGATLCEAAAAFGVSPQTVANWVQSIELERVTFASAPPPIERPRKRRMPVYLADGTRLGKATLWT
jgi:transposase-like protein